MSTITVLRRQRLNLIRLRGVVESSASGFALSFVTPRPRTQITVMDALTDATYQSIPTFHHAHERADLLGRLKDLRLHPSAP